MDATFYQRLLTEGGAANLSNRAKWRFTGADRLRFLNGQVTNDVRLAKPDAALYACVTSVKGRIEGDVFIHSEGESLLVDAEPGLRDALGARLERYIIADDVVLEDVTEAWQLWHLFGSAADRWLEKGGQAPPPVRSQRLGVAGIDLWLPPAAPQPAVDALQLDDESLEAFRILQRIPRHPNELKADAFPQEAALETRAMSFTKGCYIGQEILSRIKTTGKMPRQLVAWQASQGDVAVGDSLFLPDAAGEAKAVGTVTSVTMDPVRQVRVGLGFVRQGLAAPDSRLLVGTDVPRVNASIELSSVTNQ